jgi:uncharacterized cupin superfamily protein
VRNYQENPMSGTEKTTNPTHPKMLVTRPAEAELVQDAKDLNLSTGGLWNSPDGLKMVGTFRILSDAKFEFEQPNHEAMYILSGRGAFALEDGTRFTLAAGDLVQILPGSKIKGEVFETILGFFALSSAGGALKF